VTLKKSVFDPQGKAVHDALRSMGYSGIEDVRQGKFFELSLDGVTPEAARVVMEEVAQKVLANPVIETFRVEVE
jgi:phosphoribosylformylglycinamidine synthase